MLLVLNNRGLVLSRSVISVLAFSFFSVKGLVRQLANLAYADSIAIGLVSVLGICITYLIEITSVHVISASIEWIFVVAVYGLDLSSVFPNLI